MYFETITSCVVGGQSTVTQQFALCPSSDSSPTLLQAMQLCIQQPPPSPQGELKHSRDKEEMESLPFLKTLFYYVLLLKLT